ncbi:MAG: endonuclease domain-containing protein [Gallionella sp.]|nr:endonuclease domain-containing protein [Gallionella sp.]
MQRLSPSSKAFSRQLRREMTDTEQFLWRHLRMRQVRGVKFRRQHPVGKYVLDFACLEKQVAVELDGSQHIENAAKDEVRTAWLAAQGWQVLRFWNNDVFLNIDGVLACIDAALQSNHTNNKNPSP